MCVFLLSLDTGVAEKVSLNVPSNVVEGSPRATYSVLGESFSPREAAVWLYNSSAWASPSTINEVSDNRQWIERKH